MRNGTKGKGPFGAPHTESNSGKGPSAQLIGGRGVLREIALYAKVRHQVILQTHFEARCVRSRAGNNLRQLSHMPSASRDAGPNWSA